LGPTRRISLRGNLFPSSDGVAGFHKRLDWLILPLLLFLLAGCSTLPNGPQWGRDSTLRPGWARVETAAAHAALSPETWAPLAGAAVSWSTGLDHTISDWATDHHPLFGSESGANQASDYLAGATIAAFGTTVLATPSGNQPGEWLRNKAAGAAVDGAAILAANGLTGLLKSSAGRVRPNGKGTHSFPSGHATNAAVFATLASRNLDYLPLTPMERTVSRVGLGTLTAATAWARVEAKKHYPSDVLAGIAIGHFFGAFISDAFLGPKSPVLLDTTVDPKDHAVGFSLLFRY
jgi:membrane-associated phospholipid phosphatase